MMSFMRQDSGQDVTSEKASGDNKVSPLAGESQEEYLMPSNNVKSVKRSTMVLTVVFVIGILSLVLMIKKVTPSIANAAISEDALQIENAVASLSGIKAEMGGKLSEVVNKISSLSDIEQVEVDQLKKNPFRHGSMINFDLIEVEMGDNSQSAGLMTSNRADSLKLWTIMSSQKGRSCMINDKVLGEGDSISGLRVSFIADDYVELSANGARVLLRMSK